VVQEKTSYFSLLQQSVDGMAVAPPLRRKPMNIIGHKLLNPLRACMSAALFLMMLGSGYAADPGTLHIRFIQGEAEIKTGDNGDTIAAEANAPLLEGDKLWLFQGARMELLSRPSSEGVRPPVAAQSAPRKGF
jgi:hypothetical protein